jgi:hypothetical protein
LDDWRDARLSDLTGGGWRHDLAMMTFGTIAIEAATCAQKWRTA